jgi:outer membrane protein assembly factor BamB
LIPPPAAWPEKLVEKWRVEVGIGHSSPVIHGARAFQFAREAERELLRALDLPTGAVVWQQGYDAPYTMNPAAVSHGRGPKSTPLVSMGRVYALGISGLLSALDAETGRVLWRSDFGDRFGTTSPLYGAATSPMIENGKLLIHLGGPGKGALLALDPDTARVIWAFEGDGPGYSSPVVVTAGGIPQVVTQTDAHIVSVALDSGKLLWRIPFTTPYDQNIVTPLTDGRVFVFSGLDSDTFAVVLEREGSGFRPEEIWRSQVTFYMSTPVLAGSRILGFSNRNKGQVVALDFETGKTLWESEGRLGDNGSVVQWGDSLLVLTDGGELLVLDPMAESFAPKRRYSVAGSPTWAHPVPTRSGILIKDESTLALWRIP